MSHTISVSEAFDRSCFLPVKRVLATRPRENQSKLFNCVALLLDYDDSRLYVFQKLNVQQRAVLAETLSACAAQEEPGKITFADLGKKLFKAPEEVQNLLKDVNEKTRAALSELNELTSQPYYKTEGYDLLKVEDDGVVVQDLFFAAEYNAKIKARGQPFKPDVVPKWLDYSELTGV